MKDGDYVLWFGGLQNNRLYAGKADKITAQTIKLSKDDPIWSHYATRIYKEEVAGFTPSKEAVSGVMVAARKIEDIYNRQIIECRKAEKESFRKLLADFAGAQSLVSPPQSQ